MTWQSLLIPTAATWLAFINLTAFLTFGWDKRLSLRQEWRIPEWKLLRLVSWGGEFGALAAMWAFRHKTRKQPFQREFWGIVGAHAVLAFLAFLAWIVLH
jgi:uncharacterized membrane protein YsdA (DUF1294 family)